MISLPKAEAYLTEAAAATHARRAEVLRLAQEETQDAIDVLAGASLHSDVLADLADAKRLSGRYADVGQAQAALRPARGRILAPSPPAPT